MTEASSTGRSDDLFETGDSQAIMRAMNQRELKVENVPMILGLVDERYPIPRGTDAGTRAEGSALRERLERYHHDLVPFALPDDEGALITAMTVLAFAHFEPPT